MKERAIVLLSGGLDSAVTLAIAQHQGFECLAVSFDYGQRHRTVLSNAAAIAAAADVPHIVYALDVRIFAGSALTSGGALPHHGRIENIPAGKPVTYAPARNTIMLAHALAAAETFGATAIFIGVNAVDSDGFPDCRDEFMDAFEKMACLATWAGNIEIRTPLNHADKARTIRIGVELGVDFGLTMSCYDPINPAKPCLECDACLLRIEGFKNAGVAYR